MQDTPNLALPLIAAAQAQKHVTHNEALLAMDALVHCAVADRDLASPPASPAAGERYIVASGASGAWAGRSAGTIAAWEEGFGWRYHDPKPGFLAFVRDESLLAIFDGTAWVPLASALGAIQNLGRLGIGTVADGTNPFSAKLNKALWTARTAAEGGDGDLRYTLNKESAGDILSLLFQTGFSGRLEIGLIGSDTPSVKVSADGATWREAVTLDPASGSLDFLSAPATIASAATCAIGDVPRRCVAITGGTTILSFGTKAGKERLLAFAGALTLTHNATSLILPGGANITTAAGDTALATSDAAGNWTVRSYTRAANGPGVPPAGAVPNASLAPVATATIKGRATAGTGSPEDLTSSQARAALGLATTDAPAFAGGTFGGDVLPGTDNARALGSASFRWSDLRAITATFGIASGATVNIGAAGPYVQSNAGNDIALASGVPGSIRKATLLAGGAFQPGADNAQTLGASANRWSNTYSAKFTVDPYFNLELSSGTPIFAFDSGDYISYDRTGNQWLFNIGAGARYYLHSNYVAPGTDNGQSLGLPSIRWSVLYAGTGTINTSDAADKTPLRPFSDAELDAWGEVSGGAYRFLESVAAKGRDGAREHFGYTAQAVEAAFRRHGIDPAGCALWCADETVRRVTRTRRVLQPKMENVAVESVAVEIVDGRPVPRIVTREERRPVTTAVALVDERGRAVTRRSAKLDPDGRPVTRRNKGREEPVLVDEDVTHDVPVMVEADEEYEAEEKTGAVRYGLRYDQCHVIEAAYQRRRADRIEARLAALEARGAA